MTELEAKIDPWLQHMTWRRDYARWRDRRINQEQYQDELLQRLEQIIGPLTLEHAPHLLDLGAGMGGFAVAAALRGAAVVACDYNRDYCDIIALRAARHGMTLPIYNVAGEALPFQPASFDIVVSWDVIEHVHAPEQLLTEIARVLRPGGHALLTVVNRRAWNDPHYHISGINWLPRTWAEWIIARKGRSKQHMAFRDMQRLHELHYFHYREFVALARRHGFRVRDLREELLRSGRLPSRKRSRRIIRAVLRTIGVEGPAYRLQRRWYMGVFELALTRQT
ncbi:MAG: methyltransferase domain-containing protein [Chloroflexaceae bacterium]